MKSAEDEMHIVEKYRELGSYRAAGDACGVDHKTVKAVVDRVERGDVGDRVVVVLAGHRLTRRADVAALDTVNHRLDGLVVHAARVSGRSVRTELAVLLNNVHLVLR